MEGEFIFASFISLLGGIIVIELMNHNWFKKEDYKLRRDFARSKYRIDLKKMEKDLGFPTKARVIEPQTQPQGNFNLNSIQSLLPLLKTLDPDQLGAIIDGLSGEGGGGSGGALEGILGALPPELIQSFLSGVTKGANENQQSNKDEITYES